MPVDIDGFRALAVLQAVAAIVLLWRLLPGIRRLPPVRPLQQPITDTTVSVIVPTLNEAGRVGPCLAALSRQGAPLAEVIVVDSESTDGTQAVVEEAAKHDPRIRLERDPPLPPGWVGKVWALQHGLSLARGEWLLGVDADTEANEGMVVAVIGAARAHNLELVSFSPRFAAQTSWERWLQPALLMTLVYRTGAPGPSLPPSRLLANGQCFLVRRSTLLEHGGYAPARASFADDVFLARHYARRGVRCGFLDGSQLYRVRSYHSARDMWREWGRSIDLADTTTRGRQLLDVLFLALVLAAPLVLLGWASLAPLPRALVAINILLMSVRFSLLVAIGGSYARRGLPYALSWLADPAAVFRVALSTFRRPVSWRGRVYRDLA
jgi:dolichol-phosphate mannosyltransferase